MNISEQVIETDVLVVGAGMAGSFAAIRAKELGVEVAIVEQGKSGFCGMGARGMHQFRVVLPEDNFDLVMEGTVKECEYMIDQEYAEVAIKETWDRFQDLLKFGINFRKDESGQIDWHYIDTHFPEFKQRVVSWEPMGGHVHMLKIKKEAVQRGVKVLDRIFIVDLITIDGVVCGAVGFDTIKGDFYLFKTRAVVLASSGAVGPGHGMPQLTGDGWAMALRAGAELRGMEFGNSAVGAGIPRGPRFVHLYASPMPDYSVTNANGEEFLEKYENLRRLPGRKYTGPPWYRQGLAMLREIREGRGPCYVDWRIPNMGNRLREYYGSYFDNALKQMERSGITLDKAIGELNVGMMSGQGGGIRINVNAETTLAGLCAAGNASDVCGATEFSIPSALAGAAITGYRAGESAAKHALAQPESGAIDSGQVSQLKSEIYAPLERKQGVSPDDIRGGIVDAWINIDIREEARLKKAQEQLEELKQETPKLSANDYHELVKCHKAKNLIEYSQAVADAALMRRETRLGHYRWDYPMTDNKNWLKWVITRRVGDKLCTDVEDIPIGQWKYKPEPVIFDPLEPSTKEASS
jgi:succinate dehydrogenase/fumarate reductase flavoprotein subunit